MSKVDDYRADENRVRLAGGLEPIAPGSDEEMVFVGDRSLIRRGVLYAMLEREPIELWAVKWGVSKPALLAVLAGEA